MCQKVYHLDSDTMWPRQNYTRSLCTDFSHTCFSKGITLFIPKFNLAEQINMSYMTHMILCTAKFQAFCTNVYIQSYGDSFEWTILKD